MSPANIQPLRTDIPRHKNMPKHLRGKKTSIKKANNHRPYFSRSLLPFSRLPPSFHSIPFGHTVLVSLSSPLLSCPSRASSRSPPTPTSASAARKRESAGGAGARADGSEGVAAGGGGRGRRRGLGRGRGLLHLPGSGARPRRGPVRRQAAMRTRVPPRSDSLAPLLGYGLSSSGSA